MILTIFPYVSVIANVRFTGDEDEIFVRLLGTLALRIVFIAVVGKITILAFVMS